LGKTEIYTSIKGMVVGFGGSITIAVSIAMGIIALTYLSGVFLLRRA
jgi:hypothetical protein